jgi:hypothetical protein
MQKSGIRALDNSGAFKAGNAKVFCALSFPECAAGRPVIGVKSMTMMNGLDSIDLEMMDEEFFGPPPRFLVEGDASGSEPESASERAESLGMFAGFEKIRQLMGAW